jgi:UDP-N-acetylmuramoyl-tripeptide--D-alanyl-D-alanine ligase
MRTPGTPDAQTEQQQFEQAARLPSSLSGRARLLLARLYRGTLLRRTCFVAVTGSCGKTSTKEFIATVLSRRASVHRMPSSYNSVWHVVHGLLQTRPWHAFSVAELPGAGAQRFPLDELLPIIRPSISVVTSIGADHQTVFRTLDATAEHKGKVVDYLSRSGVAVLNADDPRVLAMRSRCKGRVITCGTASHADVRATEIAYAWPQRLTFVAHSRGRSVRVETQLCGTLWVPYLLAALAIGELVNISLDDGAAAIAQMAPPAGRLSPHTTPDGITFIQDDGKAPLWTMDAAIEVIRSATAARKFAVIGTISDFNGADRPKVVAAAHRVLEAVDALVAVGAQSAYHLRAGRETGKPVHAFATAEQARAFLRGFLRPGDLVLTKGSARVDGLDHIVRHWQDDVSGLSDSQPLGLDKSGVRLIVGLGNPQPEYALTPHNIGHRVVDLLAERLGARWTTEPDCEVASAAVDGLDVRLVKFGTAMNETGDAVRRFAVNARVSPANCMIVHDDLTLPPGHVRWRPSGSAGGHRGLGSILVALQSDAVRRVKVGIGRPDDGDASRFVLEPLDPERHAVVEASLAHAASLALEAAAAGPTARGRTIDLGERSPRTEFESRLSLAGQS